MLVASRTMQAFVNSSGRRIQKIFVNPMNRPFAIGSSLLSSSLSSSPSRLCAFSTMTPTDLLKQMGGSDDKIGNDVSGAMHALYTADAVCFDVDSTVISEEGIDVLADYLGKGPAVAELTKQAMEGDTKFQDALKMRLDLLQPSKAQIEKCLQDSPLKLTPGVQKLMSTLQSKNVDIYLVSGGFRIMIEPVATQLNLLHSNIYANTIFFDMDGLYTGFDPNEPTSRDMGKPKALELIKENNPNYQTMIMVGDGATDMQAKPPATALIGFGGVVVREAVKQKADWFVSDFDAMTKIVEMR